MKTKLLTICLLLITSQVFANDSVDIYKDLVDKCSDGIKHTFNYDNGNGYIFHGENFDKFCACKELNNCSEKIDDAYIFEYKFFERGNYFWFATSKTSHYTMIHDVGFGAIIRDLKHKHGDDENTFIVRNLIHADEQNELEITFFDRDPRGVTFFKDHYIEKHTRAIRTSSGGIMEFDSKRNYQHEIIELLDSSYERFCATPEEHIKEFDPDIEKTNKEIKKVTNENGLSDWWVAALKYHKRPTFCYSWY